MSKHALFFQTLNGVGDSARNNLQHLDDVTGSCDSALFLKFIDAFKIFLDYCGDFYIDGHFYEYPK
jgi:hypothetical protein